jgi:hypothetical protein
MARYGSSSTTCRPHAMPGPGPDSAPATSSLLGTHVMNRPMTSQYQQTGVCWRRVSVAVVSAIGGLQHGGPRQLEARREQP